MRSTTFATHSSDPDKDNRVGLKRGGFDRPRSPEERERERPCELPGAGLSSSYRLHIQLAHSACTMHGCRGTFARVLVTVCIAVAFMQKVLPCSPRRKVL